MKITDYSVIQAEITTQLNDGDWDIVNNIGFINALLTVTNIYTMGDVVKAFGQDYTIEAENNVPDSVNKTSFISTPEKICIIIDSRMSYYKSEVPICGYNDLSEDVASILMVIQTVYDRINSQ